MYTGVGGWGKLGAQTRAEAKGAEMNNSDEQEAQPLISPVRWRELMSAAACHRALTPS